MTEPAAHRDAGAFLRVHGLVKHFGGMRALDDLSFSVARGECLTLLGPSGCGKTTMLRCIAGFEFPDSGQIEIDGQCVCDPERGVNVLPERRQFGMVFQSYAVWPHMTVEQNVAYGLRNRGAAKADISARVSEVLRMVGLAGRESHNVTRLSGGQQQRVALARALVYRPKVLLFDEPLSNLDARLRERMRQELRRLHKETAITSIYVTHDQEEAMVVSDRIVVMNEGRIQQIGSPSEVYDRPVSRFVADFVGNSNILEGCVERADAKSALVALEGGENLFLRCAVGERPAPGAAVAVSFHPEEVHVAASRPANAENILAGIIVSRSDMGGFIDYRVRVGREVIRVDAPRRTQHSEGQEVFLQIGAESCQCLCR